MAFPFAGTGPTMDFGAPPPGAAGLPAGAGFGAAAPTGPYHAGGATPDHDYPPQHAGFAPQGFPAGPPMHSQQGHFGETPHHAGLPNTVEQRVQAEVNSMRGMMSTLLDALQVFTSPPGAPRAEQVTMAEASELLGLIVTVLQQDPNVGRVRHLIFDSVPEGHPTAFAVLFQYLNASFTYAPGVNSPEEMRAQIARLRVTTLKTLSKLISFTSLDHYPGGPETAQLSQLCAAAIVELRGIEVLLSLICGGPQVGEEPKIGAVECLLALIVRNDRGKQAIVETPGGLLYLATALRTEGSPVVRNYAATCIREIASTHPSHVVQSDFPEVAVELIKNDTSADVRECSIKTLEVVFKSDNAYVTRYPLKRELAEVLHGLLESDTHTDVTKTTCRLLSAVFAIEGKQIAVINHKDMPLEQLPVTFTTHWVDSQAFRTLMHVAAGRTGPKVATFASRAFRDLVQHCPWQVQIGHKVLEDWTSVDVLLKALQPQAQPRADDTDARIPLVELSIALSLMFAQSPFTRTSIHRELSGFPAYLPALRSAIMGHLHGAELAYYAGIGVYDVTGHHVNSLQGVEWNVNPNGSPVPKKASLRQVFVSQERRVAERAHAGHGVGGRTLPPASTTYDEPEVQKQKETRLTFVLLLYVIHIALAPGMAAEAQPTRASQPAGARESSTGSSSTEDGEDEDPRMVGAEQGRAPRPFQPYGGGVPPPPPRGAHVDPGVGVAGGGAQQQHFVQEMPQHHHHHHHQHHHHHHHHQQQPPPQAAHFAHEGGGGMPVGSFVGGVGGGDVTPGPVPTRTSVMREHSAHPDRAQLALMRQMREAHPATQNETFHSQNMPSQIYGASANYSGFHPGMGPPQQEPSMARSRRTSGYPQSRGEGPVGGAPSGFEPMFPTAGRPSPRMSVRPQQNPELRQTYSKFDHALRLTIHFAQYFNRKVDKRPTYKATPDGYMVRQTHIANPWTPVIKRNRLKTWNVKDLKEGDLFYFAIPFNEVCVERMEEVLLKARRHSTNAKKMFLITPQRAKGRRWFLFDLLNNIIPRVQDTLLEFVRLLQNHGEENVKFPLFMFREQEMQDGERTVHPGNLLDVVDQIKFFFSQSPNDLVGVNSAYIKDLDERMKALSAREFTGYEDDLSTSSSSISSDDEDDVPGMSGALPGNSRFGGPPSGGLGAQPAGFGGVPGPQPPVRIPSTGAPPSGGVGGVGMVQPEGSETDSDETD